MVSYDTYDNFYLTTCEAAVLPASASRHSLSRGVKVLARKHFRVGPFLLNYFRGRLAVGDIRRVHPVNSKLPLLYIAAISENDENDIDGIVKCLNNLKACVAADGIRSVAVPPLGFLNRKRVAWRTIKEAMQEVLSDDACRYVIYKPIE